MSIIKKCKIISLIFLGLTLSSGLLADMTVAPFGSGSTSGQIPIGMKKSGSDCKTKNCLEFVVKPSCFGTNLRAYPAATQMKEDEDVIVRLELKKDNKVDIVEIQYPATLTFDVGGVRRDCIINPNQNMNNSSPKNMKCKKPGTVDQYDSYTLMGYL